MQFFFFPGTGKKNQGLFICVETRELGGHPIFNLYLCRDGIIM
jgi:hypothetical protein